MDDYKNIELSLNGVSGDALNDRLAQELGSCSEGTIKMASSAGTSFIRKQVFEKGWTRQICHFEVLNGSGDKRLVPMFNTDYPVAMFYIEPTNYPAAVLPFDQGTHTQYYRADKAPMTFFKIATPEFQKNRVTLDTYPFDLRKVIMDTGLKNMVKTEDLVWYNLSDSVAAQNNGVYTFTGGMEPLVMNEITNIFTKHSLNHGVNLINKVTFSALVNGQKNDFQQFGDALTSKVFEEGAKAFDGKNVYGMKWISTFKTDIVPDNVIMAYTEEDYLGKCAELYKPVMYVKREKDRISCCAEEVIGMLIANTAGVAKIVLYSGQATMNAYPQIRPYLSVAAGTQAGG